MYKIHVEEGASFHHIGQRESNPPLVACIKELHGLLIQERPKDERGLLARLAYIWCHHPGLPYSYAQALTLLTRQYEKDERVYILGLRVWLNPVRGMCAGYDGRWEVTCRD